MTCQRCGEEIEEIYSFEGVHRASIRVSWSRYSRRYPRRLIGIIWLCADCVDEVAEATA